MAKQLRFKYDGKEYILEFTRKTVTDMERRGFVASDVETKPMTTLPAMFAGAFLAHHRFIKQETVDAIFEKMTNREDLLSKLAEMYNEPLLTLVQEPEESEGNVEWTASW